MHLFTPILATASGTLILVVPVIAVFMGLALPIVGLVTDYAKRRKLFELHHAERMAAIEKGVELPPLPPELLGAALKRRPRYLLRGLVWLFLGLGILVTLTGVTRPEAEKSWMLGFIPIGVGVAYLIYYFAEGKRVEEQAAAFQRETLEREAARKSVGR